MNNEIEIMAKTIYGEARGEYRKYGTAALEAVGQVIMNRSIESSQLISSVCLKPKQFSCWNDNDPNREIIQKVDLKNPIYRICYTVAKRIVCGELEDITGGANHYYSRLMKTKPLWSLNRTPTAKIGNHVFFKL